MEPQSSETALAISKLKISEQALSEQKKIKPKRTLNISKSIFMPSTTMSKGSSTNFFPFLGRTGTMVCVCLIVSEIFKTAEVWKMLLQILSYAGSETSLVG